MPHTCCDIFWWCTDSWRSQRSWKPGWRRRISARAKPMRERKNTHLRTKAYLKLNIRCLYWARMNRFCDDSRKSTSWVKFWALAQSADTALWHSCNRCCPSLSAHKVVPSINEHSSYMHITEENKRLKGNTCKEWLLSGCTRIRCQHSFSSPSASSILDEGLFSIWY